MNNTKKILIILAIVLAFGDIAWKVYYIVNYFMKPAANRVELFYAIFEMIDIVLIIAEIILLSMAVWANGKYFASRYGLYVTAFMLAIVANLISASTVLLIISFFQSNMVWIKEKEANAPMVEIIEETKEEKIIKLRKKRDEGKISQEEFEKEIADLL